MSTWQEVCQTTGKQTVEAMEGLNCLNASEINVFTFVCVPFGEVFSFSVLVIPYLYDSNIYSYL